jgi:hypothetical protein
VALADALEEAISGASTGLGRMRFDPSAGTAVAAV